MKYFSMKYIVLLGCIALLSSCGPETTEPSVSNEEVPQVSQETETTETTEESSADDSSPEPTAATPVE